jgi:hypothetical protein
MNLLSNEDFTLWGDGVGPGAAGWVLSGTSSLVTRVAQVQQYGGYSARLTRAGDDVALTQTVGLLDRQLIGKTLQFHVSGVATVASRLQYTIFDGITTTTGLHSGDGEAEALTDEHIVHADASTLTVALEIVTGDTNGDVSRVILHEGSSLNTSLRDYGSERYTEYDHPAETVNSGDGADVMLASAIPLGSQLVVQTLQPYALLSTETAVTDMPKEHLVAATILRLAREHGKNTDRERWDELVRIWTPYFQKYETQNRRPGQVIPAQMMVTGV